MRILPCVLLLGAGCVAPSLLAGQGPSYATPATRQVVERMLAAHGGLVRWRNAPTIRYHNLFFNSAQAENNPWWVARETIDQRTRRAYHQWPLDHALLAHDGQRVWTVGWRQANYPNFMALFFYYFVNLPWITQDSNVRLGPAGPAPLPGQAGTYDTVRVTFGPPHLMGRSEHDYFVLYVDRETGLLRAYQYGIGYGAMLDLMRVPADATVSGPVLRFHDEFTTVDGLVFPLRMHTTNLTASRTYGYHAIVNYSLTDAWDESRMTMPPNAVVDTSRAERVGRAPEPPR